MPQSVLSPASPDAALLAQMTWLLLAGGTVLLLAVAALALRACRRSARGRSRSRQLVLGCGILLPLPLLVALMAWSGWQATRLAWPHSSATLRVTVTAHMWWWEVRYLDAASGVTAVLANELRLPAGRPVYAALTSADVQHAFWVPALGGKVDMLPGRLHGMLLTAAKPGLYRGQCAEFCGVQHARMALPVVVQPAPDFDAWLAAQARPAQDLSGKGVFLAAGCASCHSVRGVAEGGALGPDLTHIASRSHLGAGAVPLQRATLLAWLANPQGIKPGARMPASALAPEDLAALADWLERLE